MEIKKCFNRGLCVCCLCTALLCPVYYSYKHKTPPIDLIKSEYQYTQPDNLNHFNPVKHPVVGHSGATIWRHDSV